MVWGIETLEAQKIIQAKLITFIKISNYVKS